MRSQSPSSTGDDVDFAFGDNVEPVEVSRFDRAFAEFHLANPHVYQKLAELAREARARGKRPGIKMLFEVARWFFWMGTENGEGFVLNNNHHSRYARLLMKQEPDLAGFFDTRELRT